MLHSGKSPLTQLSPLRGEDKGEGQSRNKSKCVCMKFFSAANGREFSRKDQRNRQVLKSKEKKRYLDTS